MANVIKQAFDLDVELALVENNAKRKIRVAANITFERLHKIIQAAYNWKEGHMYQFLLFKNGDEGERPSVEIVTDKSEATNTKTARLVHRAKLSEYLDVYKYILYVYDYGDDWTHYIDVVGKIDECGDNLPVLTSGENDAPPEDCGGAVGFKEFQKIMSKPRHKEHKEMKEWATEQGWEAFDLRRSSLRVWMAGNPGRGVWVKNGFRL